ncbi:uncharacterized protein LAESUDRAFT_169578 [Laetiporus sulphureus 93-53]|uniref:Uncharacterized protein n=1 Tax=Laetiporus sulphureus 93-53 TaxID=1314785 RepID=A0A165HTK5_9APHY|nr:uncharacterized protein LAESUDRAFT_169578 [Laetiporus sulphureus 93-53]KZT12172.1 hypothetical protein LAESUDRAFT_169578 [Laetiporus sulphureus 93-53]
MPPRRSRRAAMQPSSFTSAVRSSTSLDGTVTNSQEHAPLAAAQDTRPRNASLPSSIRHFSRLSEHLSSVSPWPTFGRSNDQTRPAPKQSAPPSAWYSYRNSFDSLILRRSSSSKRKHIVSKPGSVTSLHRSADPSRTSEVLPARSTTSTPNGSSYSNHDIYDDDGHNDPSSPQQSTSSPHESVPSTTSQLYLTRSSFSVQSQYLPPSTIPIHDRNHSAHGTFGNPSPTSTRPQSFRRPSEAVTHPPLPPLEHPELVLSLFTRSRSQTTTDEHSNRANHRLPSKIHGLGASTYPPRRRHRTDTIDRLNQADSASSFPIRPQLRRYASVPNDILRRRSSLSGVRGSRRPEAHFTGNSSGEAYMQKTIPLLPSGFSWPIQGDYPVRITMSQLFILSETLFL